LLYLAFYFLLSFDDLIIADAFPFVKAKNKKFFAGGLIYIT